MARASAREKWAEAKLKLRQAERAASIEGALKELDRYNGLLQRKRMREIVFSVPDAELRRQLIHCSRECLRLYRDTEEEELWEMEKRVGSAGEGTKRGALISALMVGVVAVWLGKNAWDFTGALMGAVVGLLYGFDSILRADRTSIKEAAEAKDLIREKQVSLGELDVDAEFSLSEEVSGLPDGTS